VPLLICSTNLSSLSSAYDTNLQLTSFTSCHHQSLVNFNVRGSNHQALASPLSSFQTVQLPTSSYRKRFKDTLGQLTKSKSLILVQFPNSHLATVSLHLHLHGPPTSFILISVAPPPPCYYYAILVTYSYDLYSISVHHLAISATYSISKPLHFLFRPPRHHVVYKLLLQLYQDYSTAINNVKNPATG
jgi:hypothetical protein